LLEFQEYPLLVGFARNVIDLLPQPLPQARITQALSQSLVLSRVKIRFVVGRQKAVGFHGQAGSSHLRCVRR